MYPLCGLNLFRYSMHRILSFFSALPSFILRVCTMNTKLNRHFHLPRCSKLGVRYSYPIWTNFTGYKRHVSFTYFIDRSLIGMKISLKKFRWFFFRTMAPIVSIVPMNWAFEQRKFDKINKEKKTLRIVKHVFGTPICYYNSFPFTCSHFNLGEGATKNNTRMKCRQSCFGEDDWMNTEPEHCTQKLKMLTSINELFSFSIQHPVFSCANFVNQSKICFFCRLKLMLNSSHP